MGRLADLIESLLDNSDGKAHDRRTIFFRDPVGYCHLRAFDLDDEQMAILFTMDPSRIHGYILPNEGEDFYKLMKKYEREMDNESWPPTGDYHLDPWVDKDACKEHPITDKEKKGGMHMFWSAPQPGIQVVLTPTARRGHPFDLHLSGEGFLPDASIELVQGNLGIKALASDYRACNFARTYLRATVDLPPFIPKGEYKVYVQNPESPVRFEAREHVVVGD